jgi:hypothetical protein
MQRQQRVTAIERFHSDSETRVFLISLKSGGMGLNLVAANHVLLTDLWWNAAAEDQVKCLYVHVCMLHTYVCYTCPTSNTVLYIHHRRCVCMHVCILHAYVCYLFNFQNVGIHTSQEVIHECAAVLCEQIYFTHTGKDAYTFIYATCTCTRTYRYHLTGTYIYAVELLHCLDRSDMCAYYNV